MPTDRALRPLIFGATGQVARALRPALAATDARFLSRAEAEFARPDTLGAIVRAARPDVVVIAAAWTDVDSAEGDEAGAMRVNAEAPGVIATAAAALGIPVMHLSTDYVFDGGKAGPYGENDPPAPLNAYGRSKLAGENAVRGENPRHIVLRTAWVYDAAGRNFVTAMLRRAATRNRLRVVTDQRGTPTHAGDLGRAIAAILPRVAAGEAPWGTYHAAGAETATRLQWAEAILARSTAPGRRAPSIEPTTLAAFSSPARRPANGALDSARFAATFGIRLRPYSAALPETVDAALALETQA